MLKHKKLNELRIISIIIFISSSFLIICTYTFLNDIPLISSLLKDYLISGNSFFFPTLPKINILWFLPKKYQIIRLSIGQCIDIIIVLNLTCYIESLIYHYIKWTILNKEPQILLFLDSYYLGSYNKNSELCEEFELVQNLNNELYREHLENSLVNYKLDGRNDLIYGLIKKQKHRSCLNQKEIASVPFTFITLNNYVNDHLIICYCSVFDYFWTIRSKIHYSPPDFNIFANFTDLLGGNDMIKIDLMVFFRICLKKKFESNLLLKKGI